MPVPVVLQKKGRRSSRRHLPAIRKPERRSSRPGVLTAMRRRRALATNKSKSLQKTPTAFEEGKRVDSQAQDAMQKMVGIVSQPASDGSQPSPPNIDVKYREAFGGGEKKKKVDDLGSQSFSLYPDSFCSDATSAPPPHSTTTIPPEIVFEMESMKKKIVMLEQQNQNLMQQTQNILRQMRRMEAYGDDNAA